MTEKPKTDLQKALQQCRDSFFAVGVFSMFSNLLMLVPAFYMLQVYDRVVTSGSLPTLTMLTLIAMFLLGTMGALEWVRSRILVRVSARLEASLSPRLYDLCFKRALMSGTETGSTQPLQDLNGLRQFLSGNGPYAFFDAPWLPVYLLIMFLFHPLIGVLGVVAAMLLITLAIANERLTSPPLSEANREHSTTSAATTTNLRNAEVIASMGMLERLRSRWSERNQSVVYYQGLASDRAGIFTAASKTLRLAVQSLALGLGAYLAVQQEISPGTMIAGAILLGRALAPVDQMIGAWKGFVSARGQYQRLNELLDKFPATESGLTLPAPEGAISAEGAAIVPPGARTPVVMGATFAIAPGDAVGVIGPSAAGKSTLIRAIIGIWPTAAGAVRIDGAESTSYNREQLGPHIGYLPQDIELFDGTVGENIARFGELDAERIVQAARDAGVHEMILQLPNGYDTVIGQSGGVLSGGQRQRIGLARALYGEPAIVILDEPNSNLDDQGNAALQQALRKLKERGCTLLIISHRTAILSEVDKLLLMREGRVADFGPRDTVLTRLKGQTEGLKLASPAPRPGANTAPPSTTGQG
ncbi:type I secretion system permease/ATPase [Chromatocurvus halotolerans]|uniref:ATP-binding cassette subfamily C protein EexD n=1 Tax=Chromatocurvus halotolerans TaxID=1132028 RepID=A0A4R2KRY2_9GAMM|nr:type I secretion system permease/ATPase [Chromatocurvus halotolerans]TCO73749.1 ATP-binding cassette subfamily C protein EexD [Chromatocurvus halotolerans]